MCNVVVVSGGTSRSHMCGLLVRSLQQTRGGQDTRQFPATSWRWRDWGRRGRGHRRAETGRLRSHEPHGAQQHPNHPTRVHQLERDHWCLRRTGGAILLRRSMCAGTYMQRCTLVEQLGSSCGLRAGASTQHGSSQPMARRLCLARLVSPRRIAWLCVIPGCARVAGAPHQ